MLNYSQASRDAMVRKWINPSTDKPDLSRFCEGNLKDRTIATVELYRAGRYGSISAASKELRIPYGRLYSRLYGSHSRAKNGGNRSLLSTEEENAILAWCHRRITQGHHILVRSLQHHANVI